jgi:hypothetical protein
MEMELLPNSAENKNHEMINDLIVILSTLNMPNNSLNQAETKCKLNSTNCVNSGEINEQITIKFLNDSDLYLKDLRKPHKRRNIKVNEEIMIKYSETDSRDLPLN